MSEPCSQCYLVLPPYCPKNIILFGRNSREPSLMECAQEVCYFDGEEALDDDKVNLNSKKQLFTNYMNMIITLVLIPG